MDELKEEIRRQGDKIDGLEKQLKSMKRIYFTSIIIKVLIVAIPIIGVILSIPRLTEIYESLSTGLQ